MPTQAIARYDAFISHSSADTESVKNLARSLTRSKLKVWVDTEELRFGQLLRNELMLQLKSSRVLVLLWSKAAARSRWVTSELLTALHVRRFIVPCVLDATPLPPFLATSAYLDRRRDGTQLGTRLARAIEEAPNGPNAVPPLMMSRTATVEQLCQLAALGQRAVLEAIVPDLASATKANRRVDAAVASLLKLAPDDTLVLNLAGYQCKNNYMLKHWSKIQAGQPPKAALLARAERYFFRVLSIDPHDESAINGLGSTLTYERELHAAEFFQTLAIKLAKKNGGNYEAALQDRALIRHFRKRAVR